MERAYKEGKKELIALYVLKNESMYDRERKALAYAYDEATKFCTMKSNFFMHNLNYIDLFGAIMYCRKSLLILNVLVGIMSVDVGREMFKLCQLSFSSGRHSEAEEEIGLTIGILEACDNGNDILEDIRELKMMKLYLNSNCL